MYPTHTMCTIHTMYFTQHVHYSHHVLHTNVNHTHHVHHSHRFPRWMHSSLFNFQIRWSTTGTRSNRSPILHNSLNRYFSYWWWWHRLNFAHKSIGAQRLGSLGGSWSSGRRELWEATNVEQLLLIPEICHLNPIIGKFYLQKIVLKRGKWIKRGRECNTGRYEL